jgi:hypothetical protein
LFIDINLGRRSYRNLGYRGSRSGMKRVTKRLGTKTLKRFGRLRNLLKCRLNLGPCFINWIRVGRSERPGCLYPEINTVFSNVGTMH